MLLILYGKNNITKAVGKAGPGALMGQLLLSPPAGGKSQRKAPDPGTKDAHFVS